MALILGIDPGLRVTGYGVIDTTGGNASHVDSGCIRTRGEGLPERLGQIFRGVETLIADTRPDCMAIEQVFVNRNVDSALKLGQARGAAICAAVNVDIAVHEYTPRQVKQALVGSGAADKQQVQHMVRMLCSIKASLALDESDALALALCHMHMNQTLGRLKVASGFRRGRMS